MRDIVINRKKTKKKLTFWASPSSQAKVNRLLIRAPAAGEKDSSWSAFFVLLSFDSKF